MKRCPKCNNLMPGDVTLCIRCGFDSKAAPAPGKVPATPAKAAAPAAKPAPAATNPNPAVPLVKVGRFRNGLALAGQGFRVLMLDKSLLLFPLVSGIASFLVLAAFVAGIWASARGPSGGSLSEPLALALTFLYYFASYFVVVFFNSALVACAMIRFRGGDPTVADGFRAATANLGRIVAWAALAATVGTVLRVIEERVGFVGKIVIALLGAAWTIATYFVVPVLVVERLGPVDAAKRSAEIVKKAWGEALVSNAGIGLVSTLAFVLIVVPCGVASSVLAAKAGSLSVGIAGGALTLALAVLVVLAGSALHAIVMSATYVYATEGKVPREFEANNLRQAFAAR